MNRIDGIFLTAGGTSGGSTTGMQRPPNLHPEEARKEGFLYRHWRLVDGRSSRGLVRAAAQHRPTLLGFLAGPTCRSARGAVVECFHPQIAQISADLDSQAKVGGSTTCNQRKGFLISFHKEKARCLKCGNYRTGHTTSPPKTSLTQRS